MNFISHYHFYKKEDKHYHLGLVLPDLIKSICQSHFKSNGPFVNRTLDQLDKGCIMHLNSDKIFHQSQIFIDLQEVISESLDQEAKWPRKWFFNHIFTEILIDRIIMEKFPDECSNFYSDLEQVDEFKVNMFLKLNKIPNYQNFHKGFQNFVKKPFLFEYLNNEKLLFALSMVYARIGIQYKFTNEDQKLLDSKLDFLLYHFDLQYDTLKNEIQIL